MAHRPSAGPVGASGPLRVLCISHSAISRTQGRLRYRPLLNRPGLQLDLIMPDRWFERGQWHQPDPPGPDEDWVHTLPIRWARGGPATWHLHHYCGLDQRIRQFRPDIIHLWQEPWSLVSLQALRLRNRLCPDAALVLEVDQNLLKRLPPPFEHIRRSVLRQTSFVLARSPEALRVVQACGYDGPSALIAYGVDHSIFRPLDREATRAALGFTGFTVGYVGRLIEEKGIGDLIEAAGQAKSVVDISLMGEGPYAGALAARAAALGLKDRLRLLPWGPPGKVAEFMNGLDVLALLTRTTRTVQEQFGRVIIEAQACGIPVLGSTGGAIPDVIGAGGWVVPEASPRAIAAVLDRLAHDPAERERARQHALQGVAARFTFEAVAERLAESWQSVMAARRQPAFGA